MTAIGLKRGAQPLSAFAVAVGVHVALAAGLVFMPRLAVTPPQAVGGFEVVDLSAFGAAHPAEPEPVEEKVVERVQADPEPEPVPEPEPLVQSEPEPAPLPLPLPKVEAKPQPKPAPKPVAKPTPQAKVQPKPLSKPKPEVTPALTKHAATGSQNAFVPPSSTAATLPVSFPER